MRKNRRVSRVLTKEVIVKIQYYLEIGNDIRSVSKLLNLKVHTVKKAIKDGRIIVSDNHVAISQSTGKSERNKLEDKQSLGKACTNVLERALAYRTGESCDIKFSNQTDLQHAGVLLAFPSLLSQGLLRYEKDFSLERGYYPTSSVFLSLAILSLLRVKTLSGVESLPPGELGKIIGLDRIPEVKTLRTRIAQF